MALQLSPSDLHLLRQHPGGIYAISLVGDHRVYVGQSGGTVGIKRRIGYHRSALRRGKHDNAKLQHAFDKYGEDVFECWVVEVVPDDRLTTREQFWINTFAAWTHWGFNIAKDAEAPARGRPAPNRGIPRSAETKEKISAQNRGRKPTPENIAIFVARLPGNQFRRGIPHSAESRAKMSASAKGKPKSATTREKMRVAANRPDRLAQVSEQSKNMPPETRAKILAKLHAPENVAKRAATRRANREAAGLIKTPEEKRAAHAAWARAYRAGPKGEHIRAKRRARRIQKQFAANNAACI